MKPKPTKLEKLVTQRVANAYYAKCSGIQIDIMDIGKVFNHGRTLVAALATEEQLADGILAFVNTIRKN